MSSNCRQPRQWTRYDRINMIGDDMISNCQAIVCIALVPTLQIHLLDATSKKQIVQRMGRHNLEFYMMVIKKLKSVASVPATAPRECTPQSSRDAAVSSLPVLPDDACQDDAGIFNAFATMLSPFASVSAGGLFNNNELLDFESATTLEQLMFPEPEPSADTR
ncbi:fungal specific transcription factor [Aspergillus niger]|uniref:Fungal specific transcription factor n=1 Tax=Aspergillus niger TaxID=5061 RepID=A0A100IJ78_ASPNG|nr:fungal specific transcription factor [Aspergillus niger]